VPALFTLMPCLSLNWLPPAASHRTGLADLAFGSRTGFIKGIYSRFSSQTREVEIKHRTPVHIIESEVAGSSKGRFLSERSFQAGSRCPLKIRSLFSSGQSLPVTNGSLSPSRQSLPVRA
jgi:hypothetical protein